MKTEFTTLSLCCERSLQEHEARLLRGFFGQQYKNRPEFHHHGQEGLIYQHPLIQYKVLGGVGRVMGVGVGSFLLRAIVPPETLDLNGEKLEVLENNMTTQVVHLGPSPAKLHYRFLTPWLALNEENFRTYTRTKDQKEKNELLVRILIGNLLSLCKAIGISVEERLEVELAVEESTLVEIKKAVNLLGLQGNFHTNFQLPPFWGIGKQSARGFGAVKSIAE